MEFEKFCNSTTKTEEAKILKLYLDENPDIIICPVDKSKNLDVFDLKDYTKKLDDVFEPSKFKKLRINPIHQDLESFNKIITNFKQFVSHSDAYKIQPIDAIKRAYGLAKNHKENIPLRPIVSSLNSITSGSEAFLQNLISPITNSCKFSVESTIELKIFFLEIEGFNSEEYEIVTFDCVSLYTSININLVLEHILNIIYLEPTKYFPPKTKIVTIKKVQTAKILEPPSRETLKSFFKNILTDYNNFHALTGFYKQTSGCSMGSKLSPGLANIFCSLFETEIIEPLINSGKILHYSRYVDDIFCILRKGEKISLLKKLNNFDTELNFTVNVMNNSKLTFWTLM